MPDNSYSIPNLGPQGGVTGTVVLVTEDSTTWLGKDVHWVVERRFLNNYRTEDGEEPEERTKRTGNTREARDGDTCWQECEEVTDIYAKQYEITLVQYQDWRINTTLQEWYDGVSSWSSRTVGSAASVASASDGATIPAGDGITSFLLGGAAAAEGVAGLGMGVFYVTTGVMNSVLPAGELSDEGWLILSKKELGEHLWRPGAPKWVQCGDRHPCADPPKKEPSGAGSGEPLFHGSLGKPPMQRPIVGMGPIGHGASGEPLFHGSLGNPPQQRPIVGSGPIPPGSVAPPAPQGEEDHEEEESDGPGEQPDPPADKPEGRADLAPSGPQISGRLIAIGVGALAIIGLIVGLVVSSGSGPQPTGNPPGPIATPPTSTVPMTAPISTIPRPGGGRTTPGSNSTGGSGFVAVLIPSNELSFGNASEAPNVCQDGGTLYVHIEVLGIPAATPVVVRVNGPSVSSTNTFSANPGQPFGEQFPIPPGSGAWTDQVVTIGGKPPPSDGATATTSAVC